MEWFCPVSLLTILFFQYRCDQHTFPDYTDAPHTIELAQTDLTKEA